MALVVAAGRGVRAGGGLPKQYRKLGGLPVVLHSVAAFARHPRIDRVQLVIHPDDRPLCANVTRVPGMLEPVPGGETRQQSVASGLEAIAAGGGAARVLIHDAARPLVSAELIARICDALDAGAEGAVPALPVTDSLCRATDAPAHAVEEVSRAHLYRVQTPQGFAFAPLIAAHRSAAPGATDDAAVARAAGMTVALVPGDEANLKLTTPEDFARAEALLAPIMLARTGTGFDVHRLGSGDHVMLCGVRVPHSAGLIGHSDADVALHALTDAILGAAAAGDIGEHFPPSDAAWAGATSDRFLVHARDLIEAQGGVIDHADVTIICELPKVGPHRAAMRERVAELLRLPVGRISVKATTTERLGFTGRCEGIAAQAAATIRLPA